MTMGHTYWRKRKQAKIRSRIYMRWRKIIGSTVTWKPNRTINSHEFYRRQKWERKDCGTSSPGCGSHTGKKKQQQGKKPARLGAAAEKSSPNSSDPGKEGSGRPRRSSASRKPFSAHKYLAGPTIFAK